ncbi:hypothetical protein FNW02_08655 [Komarekiella sp. 'clone 1']|uniref:Uncharacterized protein n=1 Tax=Komarekiella delphini-convector SJRDD-AB1 TaxID=2593771 RepID=A0AA40VQ43_9NOST|nr:hypothetical protein [Komarekiella delphini-convector SJRDD-AB1]
MRKVWAEVSDARGLALSEAMPKALRCAIRWSVHCREAQSLAPLLCVLWTQGNRSKRTVGQ